MNKLLSWPIIINATLFQITWFACVLGSAKGLLWPALLSCLALALWQLHPQRRHPSDVRLVVVGIALGLIVDTIWIQTGLLDFTYQWPWPAISPAWIVLLWLGFALTINHSLAWLNNHPVLPATAGLIGGPLSYLAGMRLGGVEYLNSTLLISVCLGIGWAASVHILVRLSQTSKPIPHSSKASQK